MSWADEASERELATSGFYDVDDEEDLDGWYTKDGIYMLKVDMDTSHIVNCIKMIYRQLNDRPEEDRYGSPGPDDSDMVNASFNAEVRHNDELEDSLWRQVEAFQKILFNRGAQHELKRLRDYKRNYAKKGRG